ncbi:hypothetical protein ABIE52_006817 [Rhodococcus sp. OAS809]|uniref:hypothetical protein n=1 Tax=Rhodococcus sp. OAS809 TaxID=2663874 RepID=UPI00178BF9CE
MTFKTIQFFETEAEEAQRLGQAPVGSSSHGLSLLPVTYEHPDKYHLVELPWAKIHPCSGATGGLSHQCDGSHRLVVLPLRYHKGSPNTDLPQRHDGSWDCRIIASDHPSYPVSGYDICCSESELRRGVVVTV